MISPRACLPSLTVSVKRRLLGPLFETIALARRHGENNPPTLAPRARFLFTRARCVVRCESCFYFFLCFQSLLRRPQQASGWVAGSFTAARYVSFGPAALAAAARPFVQHPGVCIEEGRPFGRRQHRRPAPLPTPQPPPPLPPASPTPPSTPEPPICPQTS
jgi:hypothetical protein